MNEREIYASRIATLLERLAETLEGIPGEEMDTRIIESGSSPAVIVTHITGSVRGSVLGIACGRDVARSRPAEFETRGVPAADLVAQLRDLARDAAAALTAEDAPALDEVVTPPQSLLGLAQPRPMQRREPVIGAIAHAGEHLGELMLIRDLMRKG